MSGRNGVQRAEFELKHAELSGEFGAQLLARKFGEDGAAIIVENFGTYKSGPRKGLPRGYIHWIKCTVGGWTCAFYRGGSVLTPGSQRYRVTLNGIIDERTSIQERSWIMPESASDEKWRDTLRAMALHLSGRKGGAK